MKQTDNISRDMPMTNEQKYKTAEERIKAFHGYCRSHKNRCEDCPLKQFQADETCVCFAYWLALEAKDEKPEPCPFCGGDCSLRQDNGDHLGNREYWIDCDEQGCYYRSGNTQSASDAIAAHNLAARAVMAAKEK